MANIEECEHDWNDTNTEVDNGMFLVQFECMHMICKIKGEHRFDNTDISPIGEVDEK